MNETAGIWVEWGYEIRFLNLDAVDWATVKAEEKITIDEGGYCREGSEFSYTRHFTGEIGGKLIVTYFDEEEGSEGECYTGPLSEDMKEIRIE